MNGARPILRKNRREPPFLSTADLGQVIGQPIRKLNHLKQAVSADKRLFDRFWTAFHMKALCQCEVVGIPMIEAVDRCPCKLKF